MREVAVGFKSPRPNSPRFSSFNSPPQNSEKRFMASPNRDSSPEPMEDPESPFAEEEEVEEEEEEIEYEEVEEIEEVEEEEEEERYGDDDEEEVEEEEEEVEEEEEAVEEGGEPDKDTEGSHGDMEVSSTPGRSDSNSSVPNKDAKILEAKGVEASDVNVSDVQSAIQDKHIFSEEKGHLKSLVNITDSWEQEPSTDDPDNVKSSHVDVAHGNHHFPITSGDSIGSEKTTSLQVPNKEFAERNLLRCSSITGKSDGVIGKEASHMHPETVVKMAEDSSLLSMHTPQRRPRSLSPGATPENLSKRPATVCSFYAKGWCIKGNSCRFLHQKEKSKDLSNSSRNGDVLDDTGPLGEAGKLKMSSSQERPDSSNIERSEPLSQIQRALVRAYSDESREEFQKSDFPRVEGTVVREEFMDESQNFLPRKNLNEEQLQREMPKREFHNDSPLSRGYSLTTPAVPENRHYLGGLSTSSSLYLNNDIHLARESRIDFSFRNFSGSLGSKFNNSHLPASISTFGSFDFDKRYYSAGSSSLPKSSSPYFSRPAVDNVLHNFPGDLSDSVRQRLERLRSSWEPSVPFRPSFNFSAAILSSAGSQYDPLVDSIEPRDSRNIVSQASERTINVNVSVPMEIDPQLYESKMPEYDRKKIPSEGISYESKPNNGLSRQTSLAVPVTPPDTAVDGGSSSAPKEEDRKNPNNLVQSSVVNGGDHDGYLRHQGDESKISKELKAMRFFRASLVEFVKDLVRPSWHEGRLSKDAHKMVVKKAVEKVLGALQAHQIPITTELVDQYLSTSRPKILKLVEAYIEKYANPRLVHD